MGQALLRRYQRLQKGEGKLPDLLVIDGGKGQMSQAQEVLEELGVTGVELLGIAKGPTRKAGLEKLYFGRQRKELTVPAHDPALHLLQQIRDEAHRFAITGHRGRRDKQRRESGLEKFPGVGPGTRRKLCATLVVWSQLRLPAKEDLMKVSGISRKMARTIYDALHNSEIAGFEARSLMTNISNALTVFRIILIPVMVLVFYFPGNGAIWWRR